MAGQDQGHEDGKRLEIPQLPTFKLPEALPQAIPPAPENPPAQVIVDGGPLAALLPAVDRYFQHEDDKHKREVESREKIIQLELKAERSLAELEAAQNKSEGERRQTLALFGLGMAVLLILLSFGAIYWGEAAIGESIVVAVLTFIGGCGTGYSLAKGQAALGSGRRSRRSGSNGAEELD